MPPVFPSGQFPSEACVQVRPFGATLPTAARRAPSAREAADGYTCTQAPGGSLTWKHVIPGPQNSATRTSHRDRPQRHLRGHVRKLGLPVRCDAGHILQPQETGTTRTAFPRTRINTKKSLRTISRLKTLSKHGGFLLSHLVWQYHRR